MRLERLTVDQVAFERPPRTWVMSDQLSVVETSSTAEGDALADLLGHLLYGARLLDAPIGSYEWGGTAEVIDRLGRYRLQRHSVPPAWQGRAEPRLTIAPLAEGQPPIDSARQFLCGLAPEIAARLFTFDLSCRSQLDWLLSEELALELYRVERQRQRAGTSAARHYGPWSVEQFAERDRLTHQLETLLAAKRRQSQELEGVLEELAASQRQLRDTVTEARRELDRVERELTALETDLRYRELSALVEQTTDQSYQQEQRPAVVALDAEIARWRQSLAELEAREADVRQELVRRRPEEASLQLPLADQRVALTVAQKLVADLDSEVARFARTADSATCVCSGVHARLHPLLDTLAEQVEKVAELVAQYEAALAVDQLQAEAEHLARSQTALRATVEHLLDRRQELLRSARPRHRTDVLRTSREEQLATRARLQERQQELRTRLRTDGDRLAGLEDRHDKLARQRANLMDDPQLQRLRDAVAQLSQRLEARASEESTDTPFQVRWRASEILAKLTDGQLREVHLTRGGRDATVVDRHGRRWSLTELQESQHLQVAISLQLAAVAAVARWGAPLPLMLFGLCGVLSQQEIAILALVLHDFAVAGHQVIVFTEMTAALQRWQVMGQPILIPQQLELAEEGSVVTPGSQLSPPRFALVEEDNLSRFPVLGSNTERAFRAIGLRNVGQLIAADPYLVARDLNYPEVLPAVVALWQTHLALLVAVPGLTLHEAQLLTVAGIWSSEELANEDSDTLWHQLQAIEGAAIDRRLRQLLERLTREEVRRWIADARREKSRWREAACYPAWRQQVDARAELLHPSRSSSRHRQSVSHQQSQGRGTRRHVEAAEESPPRPNKRPLRFRLAQRSPLVDAPSIGPKMAERLKVRVQLKTVADLLAANPTEVAAQLKHSRVDAETVVAWQHQAQLMCRVPELLARDTQVLVGCGFTTPEEIAAASPADLFEFMQAYCASPEGKRVLRGAEPHDLARVTQIIRWAKHRRELEAA